MGLMDMELVGAWKYKASVIQMGFLRDMDFDI